MPKNEKTTRVEKRKVVMTSPGVARATDYVPVDILDAYVADAKTRWPQVEVGTEHDPGPAGDDGPTQIPAHLRRSDG